MADYIDHPLVAPGSTINDVLENPNYIAIFAGTQGTWKVLKRNHIPTNVFQQLVMYSMDWHVGRPNCNRLRGRDILDELRDIFEGHEIIYLKAKSQRRNSEVVVLSEALLFTYRGRPGPLVNYIEGHSTLIENGLTKFDRSQIHLDDLEENHPDVYQFLSDAIEYGYNPESDSEDEISSEEEDSEEDSEEDQDLQENDEEQQFDVEEEEEDDDQEEEEEEDEDFHQDIHFDSDEEVEEPPNEEEEDPHDGGGDDDNSVYHDALEGGDEDNDEFYEADDNIPPQNNTLNNNNNNILNMPANNVGNNNNKRKGWRKKLSSVSSVAGIIGAIGIITLLSSVLCQEGTACSAAVKTYASSAASSAKDISSSLRGKWLSCLEGILSDANVTLVSDDANEENNYLIIRGIHFQDETAIEISHTLVI